MVLNTDRNKGSIALVLSGGGARGAYQVGALKALIRYGDLKSSDISVITGTSIGAVNSLILGAGSRFPLDQVVETLEVVWKNRTYRSTFSGHLSKTFLKSIQVAMLRYRTPGPVASSISIFDPAPLIAEVDSVIKDFGGLEAKSLPNHLNAVAVMATIEGVQRRPILISVCRDQNIVQKEGATFETLYVDNLTAAHGLASAALPSVLPAVDLNIEEREIRLVDGGISDNHPVDPALRLGAERAILLDSSGRRWWFDHYGEAHDTRESWEVPSQEYSFCRLPVEMFEAVNKQPLGKILKETVGRSNRTFIDALGPTWPIFRILKMKMGEDLAYEVLSYAALHKDYISALIDAGFNDTAAQLQKKNNKIF